MENKTWEKAQAWEINWHGNCSNSLNEEQKQLVYAEKMGLVRTPNPKTPYEFDLQKKSILDIGSGPYSLLLKCSNFSHAVASDPLMSQFPKWVIDRYANSGIFCISRKAEEFTGDEPLYPPITIFDEVWIYNVLEHVISPKEIIKNVRGLSRVIRIFEWLDTRTNVGHPHTLEEAKLNRWLGGDGKVEEIRRGGAVGKCYYGIFKGDKYEE